MGQKTGAGSQLPIDGTVRPLVPHPLYPAQPGGRPSAVRRLGFFLGEDNLGELNLQPQTQEGSQ